MAPVRGCANH